MLDCDLFSRYSWSHTGVHSDLSDSRGIYEKTSQVGNTVNYLKTRVLISMIMVVVMLFSLQMLSTILQIVVSQFEGDI